MRNISKQAWIDAKNAGETTLTFAAWRSEQKELAEQAGETITTMTTETAAIEQVAVETLDVSQVAVEQVMATIDTAIETVETAQAVVAVAATTSKSKLAQAIFAEELAKQNETGVAMVRKNVIARFMAEAGLSKAGANTYFQNIREKNGLVTKKA